MKTRLLKRFRRRFTIVVDLQYKTLTEYILLDHKECKVHRYMWDSSPKSIQSFYDAILVGVQQLVSANEFDEYLYDRGKRILNREYQKEKRRFQKKPIA